jgi:hypothetical protein
MREQARRLMCPEMTTSPTQQQHEPGSGSDKSPSVKAVRDAAAALRAGDTLVAPAEIDDRFVPFRVADLCHHIQSDQDTFGDSIEALCAVADALEDVLCQETEAFERLVADAYADLSPDRDTIDLTPPSDERLAKDLHAVDTWLNYLLEKANFDELTEAQLAHVVAVANSLGLRVKLDPERIERLRVYARGEGTVTRIFRTWRNPLKGEERVLDVYRRLCVVVKLCDEPHLRIKMFKDIPASDVEALLPHAEVAMSTFDRVQLFGGSAGALGSAMLKLVQFIFFASVAVTALLWTFLVGCFMLAFKAVTGYYRTRSRRASQRTRHLYDQNLGNNAAVIHNLIAMIAQEETKEALLAYAICFAADKPFESAEAVDAAVEAYLRDRFKVSINFDAEDAFETLTRLELWEDQAAFKVVAPEVAVERLRTHWRERKTWGYHQQQADQRIEEVVSRK